MVEISIHLHTEDDVFLEEIEKKVISQGHKFVLLSFEKFQKEKSAKEAARYEWVLQKIRTYYDVFMVVEYDLCSSIQMEELFSYGAHGICFTANGYKYPPQFIRAMCLAKEIFYEGLIFARTTNDEAQIDVLLQSCILPLLIKEDERLQRYIIESSFYCQKLKEVLKYVPIYKENSVYTFADKIKLKMLLEGIHLRQRLMVKQVEESFSSSGL
jgi:hypothetical protein